MPFKPPLEPAGAIVTTIVFVIDTKTPRTSCKILPGPGHHVQVVLGPLVKQECDGGERGGSRLS